MATLTDTQLVQQLYVAYFNRPADVDGLAYYTGVLAGVADADKATVVAQISADFANATEYKDTYANLNAKATINAIYHNLFGHEADIPGLNYWSALYAAGTVTLANVVTDVAAGAQGTDGTAYNNKVTAAGAFTAQIALSADQTLAYAAGSAAALSAAESYLAGVTDNASLTAALNDVATAAASVVSSVSTNLTAGPDTATGTAGNDTFNAVAITSSGAFVNTLTTGDVIDGLGGTNTVNVTVYDDGTDSANKAFGGTFKNIQIFNIDNTANTGVAAVTNGDTSINVAKLGTAVTQVWQVGEASAVTNLGANTTAGFKSIAAATSLSVGTLDASTSASVALKDVAETSTISVASATSAGKLASVTLTGNVTDTDDSGDAPVTLKVTVGKNAQTFTLNSGVETSVQLTESTASTKHITTVDLSGSTGAITFDADTLTNIATIKGGAGDDTLTITTATVAAATGVTTVTANIDAGDGDNTVNVKTTGTGLTNVTTGAGDDTVNIVTRGDGALTVHLGAGDDTFTSAVPILAGDTIDAGAGNDTLALNLVGSSNITAFSNFDAFDAFGIAGALDVDILAVQNTVTEFVTSGDVGVGAELDNIGANVGFRVIGDAGLTDAITLVQKTAGALGVTIDTQEKTADSISSDGSVNAAVVAANATSLAVTFKETFVGDSADDGHDNIATLDLTGAAATAVTVASGGGDNAVNKLDYIDSSSTGKVTSITVTGDTLLDLTFAVTGAGTGHSNKLVTVDSSASTGGLEFALSNLGASGVVKLGAGSDVIDITGGLVSAFSATVAADSLTGFTKAAAAAYGTDTDAAAAAISAADAVFVSASTVALDAASGTLTGTDSIKNGVLTFGGTGPTTLALAVAAAQADVLAAHDTVAFKYLGDTYIFSQGATTAATDDIIVKLTGVTGVTHLVADGDHVGNLVIA